MNFLTKVHLNLTLEWLRDKKSVADVQYFLTGKRTGADAYVFLARMIKQAVQNGQLKLTVK